MIAFILLFVMTMVITGQTNMVPEREYQDYMRSMRSGGGARGGLSTKSQFSTEGKVTNVDNALNELSEAGRLNKAKKNTETEYDGGSQYVAGNTQKARFVAETKTAKVVQENGVDYSKGSQFDGEAQTEVLPENGGAKLSTVSQVPSLLQKNAIQSLAKGTENGRGQYLSPLPAVSTPYYWNIQNTNQGNSQPTWTQSPLINDALIKERARNGLGYYTGGYGTYYQKKLLEQKQAFNQYSPYGSYNSGSVNNGYPMSYAGYGNQYSLSQMQGLDPNDALNSKIPWDLRDPKQKHFFTAENNIVPLQEAIKYGKKFDLIQYHGVLYALILPSRLTFIHNDLIRVNSKNTLIQQNKALLQDLYKESETDSVAQVNTVIQANSAGQQGLSLVAQTDTLEQSIGGEDATAVGDAELKINNEQGEDYSSEAEAQAIVQANADSHIGAESKANAMLQISEEIQNSSTAQADVQLPANMVSRFKRPIQYGVGNSKGFRTKGEFNKRDRPVYEKNKASYGGAADWDNGPANAVATSGEMTENRFGQQQQAQLQHLPLYTFRQPHMRWHRG